jgi:hypothetical protein
MLPDLENEGALPSILEISVDEDVSLLEDLRLIVLRGLLSS